MTQANKPLPQVQTLSIYMGCDPEFFFKGKDNQVVGADKILPEEGLKVYSDRDYEGTPYKDVKFVIDGVQAELHPRPQTCRAYLANEISTCFKVMQAELKKKHKDVSIGFEQSVKLTKEELASMDEKYKKLGCSPSKNAYSNEAAVKLSKMDTTKHLQRSAGGHIHLGFGGYATVKRVMQEEPDDLVKMLDIIVGNTCVLLDRDPGNKERRKLYGQAGEYRQPKHGFEYRTPSNFWLKSYPLMSFVFGMARLAVELCADIKNSKLYKEAFFNAVDIEQVRKAINTNNYALALKNFYAISELISQVTYANDHHPVSGYTMGEFYYFLSKVKKNGLEHWFKEDPITHWTTMGEAHSGGMHDYLTKHVRKELTQEITGYAKAVRNKAMKQEEVKAA